MGVVPCIGYHLINTCMLISDESVKVKPSHPGCYVQILPSSQYMEDKPVSHL